MTIRRIECSRPPAIRLRTSSDASLSQSSRWMTSAHQSLNRAEIQAKKVCCSHSNRLVASTVHFSGIARRHLSTDAEGRDTGIHLLDRVSLSEGHRTVAISLSLKPEGQSNPADWLRQRSERRAGRREEEEEQQQQQEESHARFLVHQRRSKQTDYVREHRRQGLVNAQRHPSLR